jgi:hypothetical protein
MTTQVGGATAVRATCRRCGRAGSERACLLGWSRQTDRHGEEAWLCESCTRDTIRGIESGLDEG